MKRSQIIIWTITATLIIALWMFSSEKSVVVKLLQTTVLVIVGNMIAALGTITRSPR